MRKSAVVSDLSFIDVGDDVVGDGEETFLVVVCAIVFGVRFDAEHWFTQIHDELSLSLLH